jgi:thiamine biosynthesis lipoprotein
LRNAWRFLWIVGGAAALLGTNPSAIGGDDGAKLERFEQSQVHMATVIRMVVYAPNASAATAAMNAGFERIKELNDILSDYLEESELNGLCKNGVGKEVKLSQDLFAVLDRAQFWRGESDGVFDVTAAPVIRLWRQARRTKRLPSEKQIADARKLVGGEKLTLDANSRTAKLGMAGMRLDVGGLAKGYVGDEVLKTLAKHGLKRAMIVLGGDVVLGDAPPNLTGWTVAVADLAKEPGSPSNRRVGLRLSNAAVSTAGDASQFTVIGGKRYSHIFDPRTGQPQVGRHQTTVVAKTGLDADAMDTAAVILGPERGGELIDKHGAAGLFLSIDDAGMRVEVATKKWKEMPKVEWEEKAIKP